MNVSRRAALGLAGLTAGLALPPSARAAGDYPNKPLRLIAPSSPGGILDITSRVVGKKLSELLKQPVVVENVAAPPASWACRACCGPSRTATRSSWAAADRTRSITRSTTSCLTAWRISRRWRASSPCRTRWWSTPARRSRRWRTSAPMPGQARRPVDGGVHDRHLGPPGRRAAEEPPWHRRRHRAVQGRGAATNDLLAGQVDFTVENVITVAPLVKGGCARWP